MKNEKNEKTVKKVLDFYTREDYEILCAERARRIKWFWTCRDGREIAIEDMTNEHLDNAIAFVARNMHEYEVVTENRWDALG